MGKHEQESVGRSLRRRRLEAAGSLAPRFLRRGAGGSGLTGRFSATRLKEPSKMKRLSAGGRKLRCARIQTRRLSTWSRFGGRLYVNSTRPSEKSEPRWRKPRRTSRLRTQPLRVSRKLSQQRFPSSLLFVRWRDSHSEVGFKVRRITPLATDVILCLVRTK